MVVLMLTYPPTTGNHAWKQGRNGARFLAPEVRVYRDAIAYAVREQMREQNRFGPYTRDVHIMVNFYMPDRRRRDLDNAEKVVYDALNGVLWGDDKQIELKVVSRSYDGINPRVMISAWEPGEQGVPCGKVDQCTTE